MMLYLELMWIYFKIGLFTIGGGYAMLPLITSELVAYGLMSEVEVGNIFAVSQMTPGPFAVNAATFSGVKTVGILGGVTTTLAVALPSLIITTILGKYFFHFEDNVIVRRALWGLRPAVTGLIAAAAVIMAIPSLFGGETLASITWETAKSSIDYASVAIAACAGVAVLKFKISPIFVVVASAILGIVLFGVLGL